MTVENVKSQDARAPGVRKQTLMVKDLIRYLSALANLCGYPRTGNRDLSEGLNTLTVALKPYANLSISDLIATLQARTSYSEGKVSTKKNNVTLPANLESISHDSIEKILSEQKSTKRKLIELGVRRFGISNSKLSRINRNDVLETIRAALDHERSLGAITHEARRGEKEGSS